uniref:Ubiquitin-like domain-containing protein n=1 Tax=Nothobranchius furzeri TaxID=105023 RepID=A0A8C6M743_NOTFU
MLIDLCNTEEQMKEITMCQLKEKLAGKLPHAGHENMRLIFTDKHLGQDTTAMSECGVQHLSVIQLVINLPGGLTTFPRHPERSIRDVMGKPKLLCFKFMLTGEKSPSGTINM